MSAVTHEATVRRSCPRWLSSTCRASTCRCFPPDQGDTQTTVAGRDDTPRLRPATVPPPRTC